MPNQRSSARAIRAVAAVAAAALALTVMSGCAPADTPGRPTPTHTVDPFTAAALKLPDGAKAFDKAQAASTPGVNDEFIATARADLLDYYKRAALDPQALSGTSPKDALEASYAAPTTPPELGPQIIKFSQEKPSSFTVGVNFLADTKRTTDQIPTTIGFIVSMFTDDSGQPQQQLELYGISLYPAQLKNGKTAGLAVFRYMALWATAGSGVVGTAPWHWQASTQVNGGEVCSFQKGLGIVPDPVNQPTLMKHLPAVLDGSALTKDGWKAFSKDAAQKSPCDAKP